ncbi:MAG: tetratricopeptide repeat protein, partial [Anaerolineae bacterium]|nr:tetratricopeptide repeat protein [Anaerolineae bacterium]
MLELWERGLLQDAGDGELRLVQTGIAALPASLNALLITRLDRLPAPVKQIVQTAAVLGQSFEVPVLTDIVAEPLRLLEQVQRAAEQQVWVLGNQQRVQFKHALLREAAYEMQPRTHLRALHKQAATAVRHLYRDDLSARWGEMAYHLETAFQLGLAEVQAEACACLQEAGHFATRQYETTAALDYYGRALALSAPDDVAAHSDLRLWQEEVVEWQGNRAAQQKLLAELEEMLPLLDVPRQTAVALRWARYHTLLPDYESALTHAQNALALALTTPDPLLQAQAHRRLGMILYRQQQYKAAASTFYAALELAQSQYATDLMIKSLNNLGMALDEQGLFAEAQHYYSQAIALQKESHDLYGETITLTNLGWQNVIMG